MPFIPPDSDVPVAQLTLAGRNLLARSIVPRGKLDGNDPDAPLVTFKLAGFVVGDGGYDTVNPLHVSPINDQTTGALATIAILDNRFDVNDALIINGVSFPAGIIVVESGTATGGTEAGGTNGGGTLTVTPSSIASNAHIGQRLRLSGGTLGGLDELIITNSASEFEIGIFDPTTGKTWTDAGGGGLLPDNTTTFQVITNSPGANTWVPGNTLAETAQNIATAINGSSNPLIENVVKATASGDVVTISALSAGDLGNLNTLVEYDIGGLGFNNFGIAPGTGFLAGGASPYLENERFPASAPAVVEPFFDIEFPNMSAVSLVCRIGQTDGNFGLGELGIYVDIVDSVNSAEIGTRILYAISHFPIVAKNVNSNFVTRAITQY